MDQFESDLTASYDAILASRFSADSVAWDKLVKDNETFRNKMLTYTSTYPETLTYPFDTLKKRYVDVVSSSDNLLRLYSWDTWMGGTMHFFENIHQYKAGNKVFSILRYDTTEFKDYVPYYSSIHTLNTPDKIFYLAVANGIYSNQDASQSIRAFTIDGPVLNDTVRLFRTYEGLSNDITVSYNFFSVVDRPERPVRLIEYDPEQKNISVAVVSETGDVTSGFDRYKFTGKWFEPIPDVKSDSIKD